MVNQIYNFSVNVYFLLCNEYKQCYIQKKRYAASSYVAQQNIIELNECKTVQGTA